MARAVDVTLTIDDFQKVSDRVAAPRRPQAQRQVRDGRPARSRRHAGRDEVSARERAARRRRMTVTGKTIAENLHDLPGLRKDRPDDRPSARQADQERRPHPHPARQPRARRRRRQDHRQGRHSASPAPPRCSTPKKTCSHGLEQKKIDKGDVIIIRYEGPKGGPGMPEMLTPTSALVGAGLRQRRRADHRRPLLRRLARLHRRPRHPRSHRGRPDRAGPKTATASPSTPTANTIDLLVSDAELAKRAARRGSARPTKPPAARSTSTSRT